ncbi:hypothetical protein LTR49_026861 [Elasticomyces elasticus]|nr:hypothetical protein LTR49_026861 [Elasticomyces elasticus]
MVRALLAHNVNCMDGHDKIWHRPAVIFSPGQNHYSTPSYDGLAGPQVRHDKRLYMTMPPPAGRTFAGARHPSDITSGLGVPAYQYVAPVADMRARPCPDIQPLASNHRDRSGSGYLVSPAAYAYRPNNMPAQIAPSPPIPSVQSSGFGNDRQNSPFQTRAFEQIFEQKLSKGYNDLSATLKSVVETIQATNNAKQAENFSTIRSLDEKIETLIGAMSRFGEQFDILVTSQNAQLLLESPVRLSLGSMSPRSGIDTVSEPACPQSRRRRSSQDGWLKRSHELEREIDTLNHTTIALREVVEDLSNTLSSGAERATIYRTQAYSGYQARRTGAAQPSLQIT